MPLYQIPSPAKSYIHQGAALQQTSPVPPVSQPAQDRYSALHRNRYIVQAAPQVHQGAASLRTDPAPTLRVPIVWNAYRQVANRYFDGPIQQTNPIPSVSQPVFNYYRPDINRGWIWEGPEQMLDGPSVQQQYIYPPNQPEISRFLLTLNASRTQTGPRVPIDQGATAQQSHIFPVSQPNITQVRSQADQTKQLDQVTAAAQNYIFLPSQPELTQFAGLHRSRFIVEAMKRFDGATAQQTYIFPVSQPVLLPPRLQPEVVKFFDAATTQQSYTFFPSQPDAARVNALIQGGRYVVQAPLYWDGVIAQQTYLFPPNQPEPQRTLNQQNRYVVNAVPLFDGITPQQTYVFPLSQPTLLPPRSQPEVVKSFDGPTAQQSYVFFPNQPELTAFNALQRNRFIVDASKFLDTLATVVFQQYLFPVTGPELSRFSALQQSRFLVNAPKILDAATVQPSSIFFPNQPEFTAYSLLQRNRFQVSAPKFLETVATVLFQQYLFPVSNPELSRFSAQQQSRFLVNAPQVLDGAPLQPSYIFFPSQPEYRYYIPQIDKFLAGPARQTDGLIAQPSAIFQPNQPEYRYYSLSLNRYLPLGPQAQLSGATAPQATDLFMRVQPDVRYFLRAPSADPKLIDVPVLVSSDVFPTWQPDRSWTLQRDRAYLQALNAPSWIIVPTVIIPPAPVEQTFIAGTSTSLRMFTSGTSVVGRTFTAGTGTAFRLFITE